MEISENGIELIKQFEGCRLTAYKCPAGVLTIGYGHTGKDVHYSDVITQEEAEKLLKKDLMFFVLFVNLNTIEQLRSLTSGNMPKVRFY